jgi:hypothetical protein
MNTDLENKPTDMNEPLSHADDMTSADETVHGENGTPAPSESSLSANAVNMPKPDAERDNATDKHRTWHVEAGRKGAQRIHQLIQEGKLYEREHGLKRGRQRLRQLIQEGWLYEREHGLAPKRKKLGTRLSRKSRQQVLTLFCNCLIRMVKPAYRSQITRMVEALQATEE